MAKTLDQLFTEARDFGRVHIYSHDDGTYSCRINFDTIKGVVLEAESGFRHVLVTDAVSAAIDRANAIIESLKKSRAPQVGSRFGETL